MALLTAPGFGRKCADCVYWRHRNGDRCYQCFRRSFPALEGLDSCPVCLLPLSGGNCGNPICGWDDRTFTWNQALAFMHKGDVLYRVVVNNYKYGMEPSGWKTILGWIVAGYLEEHAALFGAFDAIIPSPTFVGEGAKRSWDHTALVLEAARDLLGPTWPIRTSPALIRKRTETPSMVGAGSWQKRHEAAGELAAALVVDNPALARGLRVLVFDDLFTDGHTILEVARKLRQAGAIEVCGLTLGRQPWTK